MGLVTAGAVWRYRPVRRVVVRGDSMQPALGPGDRLLVVRWLPPRVGDVVAAADPRQPSRTLVKRLVTVGPAGATVAGDNPDASTDSRSFGPVAPSALRGRAVYRYFPDARRGLLYPRGHVERRGRPGSPGRLPG